MAIGTTAALVGASVAGSAIASSGARKAAKSQERTAANQLALNERVYDETTARYQPIYDQALHGGAAYQYEIGLGERPDSYRGFESTPMYQHVFDQGISAIDNSAASSGNLFSGATMKRAQEYGTGLARQEYGNHLNRLAGVASQGLAAAGGHANAGANFLQAGNNAYANLGNAQAAGAIGQANAWNNGINNALGIWNYQTQQGQPWGARG